MIYVTVGTQLSFDRLLKLVDFWSKTTSEHVVAQVGPTNLIFDNIECYSFVTPAQSRNYFSHARLIVSHAGMGSILTALELGKPIILFPRLFELGEHRNNHQLATVNRFEGTPGLHVARNDVELFYLLSSHEVCSQSSPISRYANEKFINALRNILY